MAHEQTQNRKILSLPLQVVSRADLGRLLREATAVDDFMAQSAIREPGTSVKMPRTSRLLDEMLTANKLNILVEDQRHQLMEFLKEVSSDAPMLHMSFSADPSPLFLKRLMSWLRQEIHPLVLVQIGLQPNIGAGCIIRTPNKYFDFSLRQQLASKQDLLLSKLVGAMSAQPEQPPQPILPQEAPSS